MGDALRLFVDRLEVRHTDKRINTVTCGVQGCNPQTVKQALAAISVEMRKADDWFYNVEVDGQNFFACENEIGGYTLMLAEEY